MSLPIPQERHRELEQRGHRGARGHQAFSASGQTLSRPLGSRFCCYAQTVISKHTQPITTPGCPPNFPGMTFRWKKHLVKILMCFPGWRFFSSLVLSRGTTTRLWRDGRKTRLRARGLHSFYHTVLAGCRCQSCHVLGAPSHKKALWTLVLTFIREPEYLLDVIVVRSNF